MQDLLILNAQDVKTFLPMTACIEAMAIAAKAVSNGDVNAPLRSFAHLPEDRGVLAMMPAAAADPPVFGIKAMSLLPDNPAAGRPLIQGFVALFHHETGAPCALVDGAAITAIRTAAASGLATQTLARKDARVHGILGTGIQAMTHAEAIAAACPQLEETRIWGRDFEKAKTVATALRDVLTSKVVAVEEREDALDCDIISTVTASAQPIVKRTDIQVGTHINIVGSHTPDKREVCSETLAAGCLYVDGAAAALKEAGDIVIPISEGSITPDHIIAELGEVLSGRATGRKSADDITLYKSLGNAAQDLFAAWTLYQRAKQVGAGQGVSL